MIRAISVFTTGIRLFVIASCKTTRSHKNEMDKRVTRCAYEKRPRYYTVTRSRFIHFTVKPRVSLREKYKRVRNSNDGTVLRTQTK